MIYTPQGMAEEYAKKASNPYNGCKHGCRYCYAARFQKEKYFEAAQPKKNFLSRLEKWLAKNAHTVDAPVMLSFQGDVYQPAEMELGLTRETLKLFLKYGIKWNVLTKGGMRAERDFNLLFEGGADFGTSLVWIEEKSRQYWEPGAASIESRILAIKAAKKAGLKTWISMEPVVYPVQALSVIRSLYDIVDYWKIGKINHMPELEKLHDWVEFREEVKFLLEGFGAEFYIKKSLSELK